MIAVISYGILKAVSKPNPVRDPEGAAGEHVIGLLLLTHKKEVVPTHGKAQGIVDPKPSESDKGRSDWKIGDHLSYRLGHVNIVTNTNQNKRTHQNID